MHKPYAYPKDDIHLPIEVNANAHPEHFLPLKDNFKKNISDLNFTYCELTAFYMYAENYDYDCLGLVHYRRYFKERGKFKKDFGSLLKKETIEKILSDHDVIIAPKTNLVIEKVLTHYIVGNNPNDIVVCFDVIKKHYPEYMDAFLSVLNGKKISFFNTFIGTHAFVKSYASFLFPLLTKVYDSIDMRDYTKQEKRSLGFLGEILLNVYIKKNNIRFKEMPVLFMEKKNDLKIAWNYLKLKSKRRKVVKKFKNDYPNIFLNGKRETSKDRCFQKAPIENR